MDTHIKHFATSPVQQFQEQYMVSYKFRSPNGAIRLLHGVNSTWFRTKSAKQIGANRHHVLLGLLYIYIYILQAASDGTRPNEHLVLISAIALSTAAASPPRRYPKPHGASSARRSPTRGLHMCQPSGRPAGLFAFEG